MNEVTASNPTKSKCKHNSLQSNNLRSLSDCKDSPTIGQFSSKNNRIFLFPFPRQKHFNSCHLNKQKNGQQNMAYLPKVEKQKVFPRFLFYFFPRSLHKWMFVLQCKCYFHLELIALLFYYIIIIVRFRTRLLLAIFFTKLNSSSCQLSQLYEIN